MITTKLRRTGYEPTKYDYIKKKLKMDRHKRWNASRDHPDGYIETFTQINHPTTTAIVGHSFVKRLHYDLLDEMQGSIHWAKALDVHNALIRPYLYGISGATTEHGTRMLGYLYQVRPDDIILELGTNDIGKGPIDQTARNLIALCHQLLDGIPTLHSLTIVKL